MNFVWDKRKAAANFKKHGVLFEEASSALKDILAITDVDPEHSGPELRCITFGVAYNGRLLAVAHGRR